MPQSGSLHPEGFLWPLSELTVDGLFGDRGRGLPLDPRLTVLTGENGSGKSTLLNAIHYFANENWTGLFHLPMAHLRLDFEDGLFLDAQWTADGLEVHGADGAWYFDAEGAEEYHPQVLVDLRERRAEGGIDRIRHSGMWRGEFRYAIDPEQLEGLVAPLWLGELAERFQTKLISARRLEHRLRPDPDAAGEGAQIPVVEEFATELKDLMKTTLSAYATESRRQEKILPTKIVQAMQAGPTEDPERLNAEVGSLRADVRTLADSLARVGLFQDEDPDHLPEYPSDDVPILLAVREVYRVTQQRLEQLTKLRTDLQLFSDFLNERLSNKHVELNQQFGIAVMLDSGDQIRPSQLSSGEQQLLALAYELLFGSEPETIVLLDEPELSLHVAWLQGLLTAFSDMGDSRGLQFLIASHSPTVLKGHQARERSLDLESP
ncbi:MAG: AAA family ATPase [Thermoleophilia bacterium]|nr:AAA family ATPase [Thermoleophilia bacterium]